MQWRLPEFLPLVEVPTLVVVGEADGLTPVEGAHAVARHLTAATVRVVPQASHQARGSVVCVVCVWWLHGRPTRRAGVVCVCVCGCGG